MHSKQALYLWQLTAIIAFSAQTGLVHAVQPMTETDLEIVSAITGDNILNIFGASQAGLTVDTDKNSITSQPTLKTEKYQAGETTSKKLMHQIQQSSELPAYTMESTSNTLPDASGVSTLLKSNEYSTKSSDLNTTSSEINYQSSNFKKERRSLENGGVGITRDLQIDLLKLENLRGDQTDESRNAGSIYLSDWHSRGDTRIVIETR